MLLEVTHTIQELGHRRPDGTCPSGENHFYAFYGSPFLTLAAAVAKAEEVAALLEAAGIPTEVKVTVIRNRYPSNW